MNSKRVQPLVLRYKSIPKGAEKAKNVIMKEILYEYEGIMTSLFNINYNESSEIKALFNYTLVYCIEKYDVSKKCSFNTYFYWYTRSFKRIILGPKYDFETDKWNDAHLTKMTNHLEGEDKVLSDIELQDLLIDLPKILDSEELLIYQAYVAAKIKNNGLLTKKLKTIFNKIKDYINHG